MSRIGKKPLSVPQGVTATVDGRTVSAKGPKGELKYVVNDEVLVKLEDGAIQVSPRDESKGCLLYTSPSPRDLSTSRMPSSA